MKRLNPKDPAVQVLLKELEGLEKQRRDLLIQCQRVRKKIDALRTPIKVINDPEILEGLSRLAIVDGVSIASMAKERGVGDYALRQWIVDHIRDTRTEVCDLHRLIYFTHMREQADRLFPK